jgi:hypothetical protein
MTKPVKILCRTSELQACDEDDLPFLEILIPAKTKRKDIKAIITSLQEQGYFHLGDSRIYNRYTDMITQEILDWRKTWTKNPPYPRSELPTKLSKYLVSRPRRRYITVWADNVYTVDSRSATSCHHSSFANVNRVTLGVHL